MARYYYLLTAFNHQTDSEKCAAFFQDKQFALASGITFSCAVKTWASNGNVFWVASEPHGVSLGAQDKPLDMDVEQLDEIANRLYAELSHVESFCCAIAGWEVADLFLPDSTKGYTDMRIDPTKFANTGWHGLVISESIWSAIGNSKLFQPFCPGYVWQPYRTLGTSGW